VEQGDTADDGRAGDKLVAVGEQVAEQADVLGVALDLAEVGVVTEGPLDGAVLGEVVEADDLMSGPQQILDQIARDEPGRAGDEDLHVRLAPRPRKFQISIITLCSGIANVR
jgi:hypothetical protein